MRHSSRRLQIGLVAAAVLAGGLWAMAGDWPRWRGPADNGISTETGWRANWTTAGPRRLWEQKVGVGFSSVAVSGGKVYTLGNSSGADTLWCFDAASGQIAWRQSYPCGLGEHPGPRATPTVEGKFVYIVSREGHVGCYEADGGKQVWFKNVAKEIGAPPPQWGFASSALVQGELLIVNIGTSGTALKKATGEVVWQTGPGKAGYASAVPFKMGDKSCLLMFAGKSLDCLDLADGKKLWSFPWKTRYDVNAADPIVSGDRIFISSGYNKGCALLKVAGGQPSVVWQNKEMKNHFSNCILYEGYLYGVDDNTGSRRLAVKCLDFATGQMKWSFPGLGMASLTMADKKLIVLGERGELVVAPVSPTQFKPISRANVLTGQCWTVPVLANGRIYCRNNDQGLLICLDAGGK